MMSAIVFQETRTFLRRGPALLAVALIIVAVGYAGWSGDRWRDAQLAGVVQFEAKQLADLEAFRTQLGAIESGEVEASPYDANPMSISLPAVLPPASLADFATGHADLHPSSADISPWANLASAFGRYQFDNPTTLATSSFDMALVIILLMPIVMIAVSFDVLASERHRGTLSLILISPVKLPNVVWTRLVFRNGLLWLVACLAMTLMAFLNGSGEDRMVKFGLWLAISLSYGMTWLAIVVFCVSRFKTATATAGSLVGLWLVFTLALPATVATVSQALYPTPSRLNLLSEIRQAQGDTNLKLAELTEGYLLDHPDLSVGDEALPSFYRAAFLSNQASRTATQPIVEAYDRAHAGRERTVLLAQYFSPSIIAQRLLMQSAGADLGRQHRFQNQVYQALDDLADVVGPAIVSRNRLPLNEFDGLKSFEFDEVPSKSIAAAAAWPGLFLLALSILLGTSAHRRLARVQLGESL